MSEYQYYEFLAVDRPLDERQQAEVRALSTRARITATSFTNEYHWGNFRGDPRKMMERYYDAHLYLTNWGTHQVMLRLPRTLLSLEVAEQDCIDPHVAAWACGETESRPRQAVQMEQEPAGDLKGRAPPPCCRGPGPQSQDEIGAPVPRQPRHEQRQPPPG